MKKREVVKLAAGIVVSTGVSAIVSNIIKGSAPKGTGKWKAICMAIGGFVLSWMVCEKADAFVGRQIDTVGNVYDETVKEVKEALKEKEETN